MDLYPSICDLVGVPLSETVQGRSLGPVLADPAASVRDDAFALDPRTGRWAYMRYHDDTAERYDMKKDPDQFTNLAGQPEHAAIEME